jgi:hypothetical protein
VVAEGSGDTLAAKWQAWAMDKSPACAWIIVVDTSSSASAKTVTQYVDFVRAFVKRLPKQDRVAVYSMAGVVKEEVPFDSTPEEISRGLTDIKRAGGAKSTTLIYASLRQALGQLAECKEKRQALLVLSNGQDQTEGGPEAQETERAKLIEAANSTGVVLHALGCAESVAGKKYFRGLKEIAAETDGVFEAPAFGGVELPFGTMFRLQGVMHGAGSVRIDVSKLAKSELLTVTVKTATGRAAVLQVPGEKVAEAMGDSTTNDPAPSNDAAKELEAAKALEEAALIEEAAKKAEAEAIRLAQEAEAAKAANSKPAMETEDPQEADQPAKSAPAPKLKSSMRTLAGWVIGGVLVLGLAIAVWLWRKRND